MKRTLLAVFGRGCMMQFPDGPWASTRMFDHWELGVERPNILSEQNDADPNSVIGGGEIQIAAARLLYKELAPDVTVFAYGNRSPYLKEHGYPSESEVMSELFTELVIRELGHQPVVDVFDEERWNVKGSSSYSEVHNMLTLAKKGNFDEVVFLTIQVHMNRVLAMAANHLKSPEFESLRNKWRFEISESVLLRLAPKQYGEQFIELFGSQSYMRNLIREGNGTKAMHEGVFQTKQLAPVEAAR